MACKHGTNFMEICPECELEAAERGLSMLCDKTESPSDPTCSITLPKINDELWNDYNETGLMTWKDGKPHWTQLAVDFACVLKTRCIERQRKR